jgi:hypothetical protein
VTGRLYGFPSQSLEDEHDEDDEQDDDEHEDDEQQLLVVEIVLTFFKFVADVAQHLDLLAQHFCEGLHLLALYDS